MTHAKKVDLLHALIKADNAFHASLRESGYEVSYGLNEPRSGRIYPVEQDVGFLTSPDAFGYGDLTIKWKLKEEDE